MLKSMTGLFFLIVFLHSTNAYTQQLDDRDISGPQVEVFTDVPTKLAPDEILKSNAPSGSFRILLRTKENNFIAVPNLTVSIHEQDYTTDLTGRVAGYNCNTESIPVQIAFANKYFSIANDNKKKYTITFSIPCNSSSEVIFYYDSSSGQVVGIANTLNKAIQKLQASVSLSFIRNPLEIVWPNDSDYNSFGKVYLTSGYKWDVVGHEFGHAIYFLADLGKAKGGEHYIDRCYNETLALSEGWASFFSLWVSGDLNDPDAKMEYMVPRRAPVQVENVPNDVCKGPTNEWRVSSFFWDLVDTHNDGESAAFTFKSLWSVMRKAHPVGVSDIRKNLTDKEVETVWNLNFE
jgi:hypothetical protein